MATIRIIHHVYPTDGCLSIANNQLERIKNNIKSEYTYHRNLVDKNQHELHTLKNLLNVLIDEFNDNDFILYLHPKSCTHPKMDEMSAWREYMEYHLIDNYQNHTKMLDMGFDTSGVLMGIPIFGENYYAGNFWWARVDSLKKIPKNYNWNMEARAEAENNFYQMIPNWKPYVYPIIDFDNYYHLYRMIINQIQSGYEIKFDN